MSVATSLFSGGRTLGLALVFGLLFCGVSNAADTPPMALLGKLRMTPSSMSWSVKKVGNEILATNRMTKQTFTVFIDSSEEGILEDDNRRYENHTDYEVISVVGPVLSVCESWYSDAGAHPTYGSRFKSVNLDAGKAELALTDIFDEGEVLKALSRDRVVQKALGRTIPRSVAELETADGGCEISFLDMTRSFAFHHVKGDHVAVRFGLQHGCEAMRGNFTQIGIYLPAKTGLDYFKESARNLTMMQNLWKE